MIRHLVAACLIAAAPAVAAQQLTQKQQDQFQEYYARAWDIATPYLDYDGNPGIAPDGTKLLKALELAESGLALQQENWPLWWLRGKIFQAMNDHNEALSAMRRAYEIEPHQVDTVNELTIEATRAGQYAFAHATTLAGLKEFPNSLALRARLAVVYLASGNPDDSIKAGEYALRLAPDDKVTKAIIALAGDLISGKVTLVQVRERLRK